MIKITDNIYLDADEHQFILITWNGKLNKRGNMQGSTRRYYSEPCSVIQGITKMLLKQVVASSTDLHEISIKLDEIKEIADRVATNAFLIVNGRSQNSSVKSSDEME